MDNISLLLEQDELSPAQFLYLQLLSEKDYLNADRYYTQIFHTKNELFKLETMGYIKLISNSANAEDIELRIKTKDLFNKNRNSPSFRAKELVEPFRAIFPEGSNAGGYRYRGDKQGVFDKLTKFIKKYPKFTDEQILQATKQYVNRFKPSYVGMRQAHYFISKDGGISDLLGELENLKPIPVETTDMSTNIML